MVLQKDKLIGILPAIVTPVNSEGKVNRKATRRLVNYLINAGVGGLVPLGGTGEYTALSSQDRVKLVETVVEETARRVPVIAGILTPGFKEAVMTGKDFRSAGADAVMLVTPYYIRPSQEGIRQYYGEFVSKVDLPVVLYNIPYRTGVCLEPATINQIVDENQRVIGIKECHTDFSHFTRMMAFVKDKISVLSGEEFLFLPEVMMGAKGGILATANLFPRPWIRMFEMIGKGNIEGARRIHFGLLSLMDAAFAECNPGPIKEVMGMIDIDVGHALRPLTPPNQDNLKRLRTAVRKLLGKPLQ
jgi:4-hydroxy-tetrahydrodipicolinate synthase